MGSLRGGDGPSRAFKEIGRRDGRWQARGLWKEFLFGAVLSYILHTKLRDNTYII